MTPTEARVAARVADGLSPDQVADELKLRTGTVRWHVKRIMARAEAGRQAELVHLVLSSPLGYRTIRLSGLGAGPRAWPNKKHLRGAPVRVWYRLPGAFVGPGKRDRVAGADRRKGTKTQHNSRKRLTMFWED